MNLSDKTIIVVDYGNYADVALRLARDYDKVYYYVPYQSAFPRYYSQMVGVGLPGVERIYDFWGKVDQADVIMFCDLFLADWQVYLREKGYAVFGSGYGEELEIYRPEFKDFLKSVDLPVGKYEVINGLTALREYLKTVEDKWVKMNGYLRGQMETWHHENYDLSKPVLDEMEHTLGICKDMEPFTVEDGIESIAEIGYDGAVIDGEFLKESLCGIEVKDNAYCGAFVKYKDLPEQVKICNEAVKDIMAEYGYRGFYSNEIRIAKEDKKGYYTDATCFSDDTDVLTDKGWKRFYELDGTEKVCTLNPETMKIEYHKPYNYISYNFNGNMISISNKVKTIEALVTPSHSVWRTNSYKSALFEEKAGNLTGHGFIPRTGIWDVPDIEYFELPEYHKEWDFMNYKKPGSIICKRVKHTNKVKIKMDYWVAFMAWYLAEGSIGGKNNNNVSICQILYPDKVREVIEAIGFKYSLYHGKNFQINSVQLGTYLKQFGISGNKYIPDYILNASKRQIRIFLDNYCMADGSFMDGRKRYRTSSKTLADQLQELILKVGSCSNINHYHTKGTLAHGFPNGKEYYRNFDQFHLEERKDNSDFWFETGKRKERYINEVQYNGLVYDVTVKNHIIMVRRNGKQFWSGNCRCPEPPTSVAMEAYDNFSEMVWEIAHGNVPEVKYSNKWGVEAIITSDWATEEVQAIYFPEEIRRWVKIKNHAIIGGVDYFIPQQNGMKEIGALVFCSNSLEDAILEVKSMAKKIKGYGVKVNTEGIDEAVDKIKDLIKNGIKFLPYEEA